MHSRRLHREDALARIEELHTDDYSTFCIVVSCWLIAILYLKDAL